jgi:hypothetical protein
VLLRRARYVLVVASAAILLCGRAGALQVKSLPLPPGMTLEPLRAQTERLLQSPDLRDRTWGAYLVGRLGLQDLVPRLVTLLDPHWPFGSGYQRIFSSGPHSTA